MTAQPVTLADCITLTKGKPPAEIPYFGDDAEPYLSPEYLRGKGTAEPAKPAANAVRVGDGDTILLWDGSNAGEFFRGRNGLLSSTMTHIGHSEEFEPEYFYYAAKQWEAYLKSQTSGSGIPHVDKEVLGKLEILQLAPGEQRLVADILAKIDNTIEQTEAIIAKQQRIKTGLMQDLLTKGIDEQGNIRSEATHEFKDLPLGRMPVEWDCQTAGALLSDGILSEIQDGNHGELHPKSSDFVPEGVPFVMASDITGGVIDLARAKRITEAQHRSLRIGFAKPRDVLLSHKASIGFVAVVPDDVLQLMLTPQVTYYRIGDSERMNYKYLAQFFRSEKFQEPLKSLAKQSTRDYIGILAQQDLQIAYPLSITEQVRIANMLAVPDQVIDTHSISLNKLRALKTGLMHDLLTGKVRVTELIKQPAAQ